MIKSPSGRMPEKAPRWDLVETEACSSRKVFWWILLLFGNIWEFIGQRLGLEESCGAHKPGSAPPRARPEGLWAPRMSSNPSSTSINSKIFPKHQKRPPKYFSAATSFCSRDIPSWGLFRYSAGGGFDHGGPLHQPCCPSDDA